MAEPSAVAKRPGHAPIPIYRGDRSRCRLCRAGEPGGSRGRDQVHHHRYVCEGSAGYASRRCGEVGSWGARQNILVRRPGKRRLYRIQKRPAQRFGPQPGLAHRLIWVEYGNGVLDPGLVDARTVKSTPADKQVVAAPEGTLINTKSEPKRLTSILRVQISGLLSRIPGADNANFAQFRGGLVNPCLARPRHRRECRAHQSPTNLSIAAPLWQEERPCGPFGPLGEKPRSGLAYAPTCRS